VFHCAGLTADYAARPFDTVEAQASLLARCCAKPISTPGLPLLDPALRRQPDFAGGEVDEDTPLALDPAQPRHLYDLSKALGESLCRQASGGRARIARLSCVYSGGDDDADGFLGTLLARVRATERGALLEIDFLARRGARLRPRRRRRSRRCWRSRAAARGRSTTSPAAGTSPTRAVRPPRRARRLRAARRARRPVPCPAPVSIERMPGELGWRPRGPARQLPALLGEAVPC
jgi:hypothetical protein